jgi:chitinase
MREAFESESEKTGRDRLLVTMAVPASLEYAAQGFDIETLDRHLDFFNLLSYDYHSSYEPSTNHHSPLFRPDDISEFDFRADLNIDATIRFYIKSGASRDKLVLGIPTYGRSYTLLNPDAHATGSPTDGPGEQGKGTKEDGYLAYYEICEGIQKERWDVVRPYPGKVGPYAHHGNQWVGYDDISAVQDKAIYASEEGLGGIMFWTIDNDDFRGACHDRPFPLIEAAKEALYGKVSQSVYVE